MKQNQSGDYEKGKAALRRLLILLLNFILIYAALRLVIELAGRTGQIWLYYLGMTVVSVATAGLFIAYFILNGFTFEGRDRTWDELPEAWDDAKKRDFLKKLPARREKAKSLLFVMLPLTITLAISFLELFLLG